MVLLMLYISQQLKLYESENTIEHFTLRPLQKKYCFHNFKRNLTIVPNHIDLVWYNIGLLKNLNCVLTHATQIWAFGSCLVDIIHKIFSFSEY